MDLKQELEALREEFESFKTMTVAVVQGQAMFDKYTAAVMKAHVTNHAASVPATDIAEMENARDEVHEAGLALG